MSYAFQLSKAGVPEHLIAQAEANVRTADKRSKGLLWKKWSVRLWGYKELAKMLAWEDERLFYKYPELLDKDIAPVINITCNGDNANWNPVTNLPEEGQWLNKDPESAEYKEAVASCYWCEGHHPRSLTARMAWYHRNAGEGYAYQNGLEVGKAIANNDVQRYNSADGKCVVFRAGDVWLLNYKTKLVGKLAWETRIGFEIDNVWKPDPNGGPVGIQKWYSLPGFELNAPVTWSKLPTFS